MMRRRLDLAKAPALLQSIRRQSMQFALVEVEVRGGLEWKLRTRQNAKGGKNNGAQRVCLMASSARTLSQWVVRKSERGERRRKALPLLALAYVGMSDGYTSTRFRRWWTVNK